MSKIVPPRSPELQTDACATRLELSPVPPRVLTERRAPVSTRRAIPVTNAALREAFTAMATDERFSEEAVRSAFADVPSL